jgi:hypothetical protein
MIRFLSWLATGIAAAFLVVASVAFSQATIAALAFAIGIGTLVVSAGIAYAYYTRNSVASVYTAVLVAVISVWTIVSSVVFSEATVQNLALASALAISGLSLVGLTAHERSHERALQSVGDSSTESESSTGRDTRLAAAA